MLHTIGYEGASPEGFIATLKKAGVTLLVDVREFPGSRKKGFSKNSLAQHLSQHGIDYVHLRGLGDPKPGRDAARAGNYRLFLHIFEQHMNSEKAQADLARAMKLIEHQNACLMCFEREHTRCHRAIIAEIISSQKGIRVHHLRID